MIIIIIAIMNIPINITDISIISIFFILFHLHYYHCHYHHKKGTVSTISNYKPLQQNLLPIWHNNIVITYTHFSSFRILSW